MNIINLNKKSVSQNYEKLLSFVTGHSKSKNLDLELNTHDCSLLESEIIFAILNGYFQDKEILIYLSQFKHVKYSSIRYNVKKLLIRFNTNSRSELFRKLLLSKFLYVIPESIHQK